MSTPQTIYYLDDDTDDLYTFKEVAETLGHSVSIFINGQMFLEALRKGALPDIIFLDIRMPVFHGEEILMVIKKDEEWKNIPVVMISGFGHKALIKQYLESGANYLMKKPNSLADYRSSLELVLNIDWNTFQAYA